MTSPFGREVPPVVGAPFSGVGKTTTVTKLLDGNRIVHAHSTRYFRDNQGRTRVEHMFLGRDAGAAGVDLPMMASIYDPVRRETYMLHGQVKRATVFPVTTNEPVVKAPVPAPPVSTQFSMMNGSFGWGPSDPASVKTVDLGEKTIGDIRVVGARMQHTIPANSIGNERAITVTAEQWFSPDLGVVIESSQRSPTGMESMYQLEQIVRGEQDRELFTVPADYVREEPGESNRGFTVLQALPSTDQPAPEK
jgi:hypothetical protein